MTTRYRVRRVRFSNGREEFTAQRRTWFGAWVSLYWFPLFSWLDEKSVDGMFSARFSSMRKAVDAIEDVKAAKRARSVLKKPGKPVVVWLDGVEVKPFSAENERGTKVYGFWKRW